MLRQRLRVRDPPGGVLPLDGQDAGQKQPRQKGQRHSFDGQRLDWAGGNSARCSSDICPGARCSVRNFVARSAI